MHAPTSPPPSARPQESEVEDGTSDLHKAFVDFNLDRKVSL